MEKFNNLHGLVGFLDSVNFFHHSWCQLTLCSNCTFIDKFADMLYEDFHDEDNTLNKMKNYCREDFGKFLSLAAWLKCLVALDEEHRDLILYIWNVNMGIIPWEGKKYNILDIIWERI